MYHSSCVEVRGQFGVSSHLLPYESRCQPWQQVLSHTEPSNLPHIVVLFLTLLLPFNPPLFEPATATPPLSAVRPRGPQAEGILGPQAPTLSKLLRELN